MQEWIYITLIQIKYTLRSRTQCCSCLPRESQWVRKEGFESPYQCTFSRRRLCKQLPAMKSNAFCLLQLEGITTMDQNSNCSGKQDWNSTPWQSDIRQNKTCQISGTRKNVPSQQYQQKKNIELPALSQSKTTITTRRNYSPGAISHEWGNKKKQQPPACIKNIFLPHPHAFNI